jgi:hypothetical protein
MGYVKEPVGVDLNIGPTALSAEDRQTLSAVIAQYKLTKEVPKSKPKLTKTTSRKNGTTKLRKRSQKTATKKAASTSSK